MRITNISKDTVDLIIDGVYYTYPSRYVALLIEGLSTTDPNRMYERGDFHLTVQKIPGKDVVVSYNLGRSVKNTTFQLTRKSLPQVYNILISANRAASVAGDTTDTKEAVMSVAEDTHSVVSCPSTPKEPSINSFGWGYQNPLRCDEGPP